MKKNKKAFKEIVRLHDNLKCMLDQESNRIKSSQDNKFIMLNITSLLEVCVLALDGKGMFLSSKNQNVDVQDSVARVLEMVMGMLPHAQMEILDEINQHLPELEKPN